MTKQNINITENMNAVVYLRYSSDNQTEQSIEGQRRVCMEFAEKNGYTVIHEYADRAKSALTDNRPEFQRMIKEASTREFRFIIVYKLDRFSRNRYDSAKYKHILKKYDVRILSATEYLSDDPSSIMTEALLEANAEYYSAELSQKTKRGMKESALKCQTTGAYPPLGYKWGSDKKLEIDESARGIAETAFKMYASGDGKQKIADTLNGQGYRTRKGNKFTSTSFDCMLTNKKYIGTYTYDNEVEIENGCPALIERELWENVQVRVERVRRAPAAAKAKVNYLLSGKLFCGYCGANMVGESGTSRNGTIYNYYKCRTRKNAEGCKKKSERQDYLEWYTCERVLQLFCTDCKKEDIADLIIAAYVKAFGVSGVDDIEKRLKSVKDKISKTADIIIETGNKAFMSKLEDLQVQESEIEDELISAQIASRHTPTRKQLCEWIDRLKKLDICEPDIQYHIINIFVSKVFLYDDKVIILFNLGNNFSEEITIEQIREFEKDIDDCSDLSSVGDVQPDRTDQNAL